MGWGSGGGGGGERGPKDCTVTEDDLGLQFLTLGVEKLYYVEAQTKMLISCENQHFAYGKTKGGSPKDCTVTEDDLGLQFVLSSSPNKNADISCAVTYPLVFT